ncbi:hypothetical protein cypCar_00044860 [Cyprinus carpio]|nr:hypothetical protein cypCar_00044860 [Cyprinus carpio]
MFTGPGLTSSGESHEGESPNNTDSEVEDQVIVLQLVDYSPGEMEICTSKNFLIVVYGFLMKFGIVGLDGPGVGVTGKTLMVAR